MNRRNIIIMISILAFVTIVGGISYAYFVYNKDIGTVTLNTGDISINFSDVSGNATQTNVIPVSDNEGKVSSNYIDFSVDSTVDTERIYYEIYILPKSGNTLDTSYLKTYLTDQNDVEINGVTLYNNLSDIEIDNAKGIYEGLVELNNNHTTKNESKDFRLRVWLDESYSEVTSKTFQFDIYLYAKNVPNDFVIATPTPMPTPTPAPVPTIPSCQGCKYIYTTTEYQYGGANNPNATQVSSLTGATNDYTSLNKNVFIGFTETQNGKVDRLFVCGIKEEAPNQGTTFCIEGSTDGSTYSANISTIAGSSVWDDASYTAGRCHHVNVVADNVYCEDSLLYASIDEYGWGVMRDQTNNNQCFVSEAGTFYCS